MYHSGICDVCWIDYWYTPISYMIGLNLYVMNPPLQESSKSIQTEAFHVFKVQFKERNCECFLFDSLTSCAFLFPLLLIFPPCTAAFCCKPK